MINVTAQKRMDQLSPSNEAVAQRLEEVARLLEVQGANQFRVAAYRKAAATLRRLPRPVQEIVSAEGHRGLTRLEGMGPISD